MTPLLADNKCSILNYILQREVYHSFREKSTVFPKKFLHSPTFSSGVEVSRHFFYTGNITGASGRLYGRDRFLKEIAIYGKGGIGKSTLSANISAALSFENRKVLQIGCDPKHDSTRLLMHGARITTVLDYIRVTGVADYRLDDILYTGYRGIGCIEAGGPEPGVGCAGRGIITAFELLKKFHVKENYDLVIYDVLGDVVCGGFAVPIRREYADTIFLVTSGEYMSLYAANNILRGIRNYDQDQCRVAGILYNSRNVRNEDNRVKAFARAVGLPIFAKIPRDDIFAQAEKNGCTAMELLEGEGGEIFDIFRDIAGRMVLGLTLYPARPLTDENLENLVFYGETGDKKPVVQNVLPQKQETKNADYDAGIVSKNVLRDEPLHGCAFNGAMNTSIHLIDVAIIAHSPKSCAYISYQTISSAGRRQLYERGALMPVPILPNIVSTDMDESDMVFGGMEKLMETVKKAQAAKPRAVVIISSCPAGIIGDDIDKARELSTPDCPVVTIKTDGNLTGDYLQGMLNTYIQLARQIVDPTIKPQRNVVNVVFEKVVANNTQRNFDLLSGFLKRMGVTVNCRFLYNTGYDSLRNFCSADLNLLAYKDYTGVMLEKFFEREYGCEFYPDQFPTGFSETCRWLRGLGKHFGQEAQAEKIIEENREAYWEKIRELKPYLEGKRLMIITYNHELDWIIEAAQDVGVQILKIGVLDFSQDEGFRTRLDLSETVVEEDYDRQQRPRDVAALRPDILLTNYESTKEGENCVMDTIPLCPDNGFFAGLHLVERWKSLCARNQKGGWENDRHLFNKYYPR